MILRPVETIEIPTADAFPVRGDVYAPVSAPAPTPHARPVSQSAGRPASQPARGLVVLAHGFKGYKTWGFLPYLATRFCDAGFLALSIDFSFNGTFPETRHELTRYPRADLFQNNTLEREYEDLRAVIQFVEGDHLAAYVRPSVPLGLYGHSRGGIAALLNALENDRIKALCTWSAPDDPDSFTPQQKEKWRRQGTYDFTDARDGTSLSLSVRYLDDLEKNCDTYRLCERAAGLRVPHLIVHGEMDLAVNAAAARALHAAESGLTDKRLLAFRTGHTFGITESPDGALGLPPRPLVEAADATVSWFATYLTKGS